MMVCLFAFADSIWRADSNLANVEAIKVEQNILGFYVTRRFAHLVSVTVTVSYHCARCKWYRLLAWPPQKRADPQALGVVNNRKLANIAPIARQPQRPSR